MSAKLCSSIAGAFSSASNFNIFFEEKEINKIRSKLELREQPPIGQPGASCKNNLFFGFFFDGTKNNYVLNAKSKTQSNVARLYDCYPGLSVLNVLPSETDWTYNPSRYTNFYRVYIPGVASPFKEVGDTGEGAHLDLGGAGGFMGDAYSLGVTSGDK